MWPFKKKERWILFSVSDSRYFNGHAWIPNESGAKKYSRRNAEALNREHYHMGHVVTILEV